MPARTHRRSAALLIAASAACAPDQDTAGTDSSADDNIAASPRALFVGIDGMRPDALVAAEGWQSLVPDAADGEDAIAKVRDIAEWDPADEKQYGVLALRVREARRKER